MGIFCSSACHEEDFDTCMNNRRVQESYSDQMVSLYYAISFYALFVITYKRASHIIVLYSFIIVYICFVSLYAKKWPEQCSFKNM